MAFTIRNANYAAGQALFTQDVEILAAAAQGDGVLTGCAVTAQGTPDMTVHGAAGSVAIASGLLAIAADDFAITAAHATLPRIDLLSVPYNSAAVVVTDGTANASPEPPSIPVHDDVPNVALAMVYVRAATTTIETGDLIDKRVSVGFRKFIGADSGGATPLLQAVGRNPRLDFLTLRGTLDTPTAAVVNDVAGGIVFQAGTGGVGGTETFNLTDTIKATSPLRTLTQIDLNELKLNELWDDAGHVFLGLLVEVDNSASDAASLLFKLSTNATLRASIDAAGNLVLTGGIKCVLPTSAGATGTLWNDAGIVKVSP